MSITVNLYYTGTNGNARKFAEEMISSGTVKAIREEEGNLKYDYFFPLDDPETQLTAALLKDQKIPFALYSTYSRKPAEEKTAAYAELVLASEAAMFFTVAEDGAEFSAEKTAYDSRLEQNYPFVIMDYYGDGRAVSRVLCGHEELLEIGADGCVIRPDVRKGEQFDFDVPLLEALEKVMPRME